MAKSRKKTTSAPPSVAWKAAWIGRGFLLFFIGYWAWFYFWDPSSAATQSRVLRLSWALLPDLLVSQWSGRDFSRFAPWDHIPILLLGAFFLVLAYLIGRLLLDLLRLADRLSRLENGLISIALGMNGLSLLTLAAGLAGWLHSRGWLVGIILSVAILSVWRWRHWHAPDEAAPEAAPESETGTRRWLIGLFWCSLPFALLILLGGMARPWHFDVREYHLQVPKEWYLAGRITFLPHNIYGNMPLGAEMHSLLAMVAIGGKDAWWWGSMVGKLIIATAGPLTALSVYAMGKRYVSPLAGAVGAFVYISIPWVAFVSMSGLIDGVSSLYFLLTLHVTVLWSRVWKKEPHSFAATWGLPAVAGLLAGGAVSCKYPAIAFVVPPVAVWLFWTARGPWRWKCTAVFMLATTAACGLWFGKNWVQTGNPTYPLLYKWFDGKTRTPEKDEQWRRAHRTPRDKQGRPRYSLHDLTHSVMVLAGRSEFASPLLIPLGLLALFAPRRHRTLSLVLLGMCAYMFAVWWLLTHRVDRFMLPALPFAALLAGIGATWNDTTRWRWTVAVIVLIGAVPNLVLIGSRGIGDNRFFVSLSELREDRPHPSDFTEAGGYYTMVHVANTILNQQVRPGFRILAVGEAQVFDLDMPVIYNTCFDDCQFERLMRGHTREERYQSLQSNRISHILIAWRELDRYRSPGNYGYSKYITRQLVWD